MGEVVFKIGAVLPVQKLNVGEKFGVILGLTVTVTGTRTDGHDEPEPVHVKTTSPFPD